jgi:CRP/FNR family cyclic AMP-dependent transcriptional regulator
MQSTYDLVATEPFFAGLADWQIEWLSRNAQRTMFHRGARLFREGDPADRFWLITKGRVDLDTRLPDRGDVIVATLGPGAVLGWSWLFPPYRWHFGAVAVATTHAVELDGPGVRELCQRDPVLGYEVTQRLMRVVVDRLQATRSQWAGTCRSIPVPAGPDG